ncbi:MAG: ABC transporter substrate-binding protein, partial [Clostridia bacterium]|nr:ABC transporter substrate-binding protein [Clostridia bacterium]
MKRIISLVLACVMVLSVLCLTSCAEVNYAENNTKIKIGATGPLTGGAAIYGIAVKNAAQLAVEEINAAGGLNGMEFELVMLDDEHDPANVDGLNFLAGKTMADINHSAFEGTILAHTDGQTPNLV